MGVNFTDGIYVEIGDTKEKIPFLNALKQKKLGITADSPVLFDIFEALEKS